MKSLTLWQPWASLVAVGLKQIETRSWSTNYRGPLAIHAAKSFNDIGINNFYEKFFYDRLKECGYKHHSQLPTGAIVGVVYMVDCLPISFTEDTTRKVLLPPPLPEYMFGDYREGRYGWILEHVKRLTNPIPVKGMQGLWDYPDEIPLL